jgi:hypothetical protein
MEWSSAQSTLQIHFPKPGPYVLKVYANDCGAPRRNILVQRLHSYWVGIPQDPQTYLGAVGPPLLWGLTSYADHIGLTIPENFSTRLPFSDEGFFTTPSMKFTRRVHITAVLWPRKPRGWRGNGKVVLNRLIEEGKTVQFRLRVIKKGAASCGVWRLTLFAQPSPREPNKSVCNFLLVRSAS